MSSSFFGAMAAPASDRCGKAATLTDGQRDGKSRYCGAHMIVALGP
jgi:hypothetical protein